MISPITEWAGLKGDALRNKRAQLRIEQEESLFALAQSVQRKTKGVTVVTPVPPKLFVPILEKASLEESSDDTMINLWANLLASAGTEASVPPRFVNIVGDLNARQAKLLIDVATKNVNDDTNDLGQDVFETQQSYVEATVNELFKRKTLVADDVYDNLTSKFDAPGVALVDLIVEASNGDSWSVQTSENRFGKHEVQADLQIMASLGLFREIRIVQRRNRSGINEITVIYFLMTEMGVEVFGAVSD